MGAIQGRLGILPLGRKVWGSVRYWTWFQSMPFPHIPATALRSGNIRLIVQGQMYDGRMTIYIYSILYSIQCQLHSVLQQIYTDKFFAFIMFDLYGSGLQTQDLYHINFKQIICLLLIVFSTKKVAKKVFERFKY